MPTLGRLMSIDLIRGNGHQLFINERSAGNYVVNRFSCKLKGRRMHKAPAMWVRADGAFEPLVAPELFIAAQDRIASRSDRLSDDEMLHLLRATFDDRGYLSGLIIDESERLPSSSA